MRVLRAGRPGWTSLGSTPSELLLDYTLPTGQTFRWKKTAPDQYTGVIQGRVVALQQHDTDVEYKVLARAPGLSELEEADLIHDYFNLSTKLTPLATMWSEVDTRFSTLHKLIQGARVLRQDPFECLMQFICSSNNHISRIQGMVERLCCAFGTPLPVDPACLQTHLAPVTFKEKEHLFYSFPSLQQLQGATEDVLRLAGFGYRAKFIVGTVAALMEKEGGGEAWLQSLRTASYAEASEALQSLPGVGPKVAACVCLFSLDKHAAIPVDTHVWQLACRHYTPHLKGKTLTKPLMAAVEQALVSRFGPYAGWAHNTLFIAELASQRHLQQKARAEGEGKAEAPVQTADSPSSDERILIGASTPSMEVVLPVAEPALSHAVTTPQQHVPSRQKRTVRQRKRRLPWSPDSTRSLSPNPVVALCL